MGQQNSYDTAILTVQDATTGKWCIYICLGGGFASSRGLLSCGQPLLD